MSEEDEDATVLVFRSDNGPPVAVPAEIVASAQRPYRAYLMAQEGEEWSRIAAKLDYATAQAAKMDVQRYMNEGHVLVATQSKQEMLSLEVARLNSLQKAIWSKALEGNLPAVGMAVTIVRERSKLLGLEEMDAEDTRSRTIVITNQDYQALLEQAASES